MSDPSGRKSKRSEACAHEIREALKRHGCRLVFQTGGSFSRDGLRLETTNSSDETSIDDVCSHQDWSLGS
jgi:hypothetical protein